LPPAPVFSEVMPGISSHTRCSICWVCKDDCWLIYLCHYLVTNPCGLTF
jgi:hypothetical protein